MYVLLNGSFGVGKTSVARELRPRLPGAAVFDPERIGFVLRRLPGGRRSDYQHLRAWRRWTVRGARALGTFRSVVIVPMTFSHPPYLEEVRAGLAEGGRPVLHFCLTAPLPVVRERLAGRGEPRGDPRWSWVHRRAEECCAAHASDAFAHHVATEGIPPATVAGDLAARIERAAAGLMPGAGRSGGRFLRRSLLPGSVNPRFVVTGGPGAGKTTLLEALHARGHPHAPDSARAIVRRRKATGETPRPSPREFRREMLRLDVLAYRRMPAGPGPVFFDRGVLDALAFADQHGDADEALVQRTAARGRVPELLCDTRVDHALLRRDRKLAMLRGSCACGRVRYEIRGPLLGPVTYCHCWRCRKHSGSSFGTTVGVATSDLVVVAGEDLLSSWESSPGVSRFFAGCCGSPIYKRGDETPGAFGLRLGTLDDDPGAHGDLHFRVGSKVPWLEIHDDLPREPSGPPFGERD